MTTKYLKTAAPSGAGNSLGLAWMAFAASPMCQKSRECFARELDMENRTMLPENTLGDRLAGRELEIRQNANLMLLDGHLLGNEKLTDASRLQDVAAVTQQIRRSLASALSICRKRLRRSVSEESKRSSDHSPDEFASPHHSIGCSYWELPYEAQRELALLVLSQAVAKRELSRANAELASMMIISNLNQSEMGKYLGISRQAVNQRLESVRKSLRSGMETQEFPLP